MNIKNKDTLLNMISNIVVQVISILYGFIIPKIVLQYFGSEVNGLVSSLTQFLSYISLIEGGITGVIYANLYKPLVENDYRKISSVIKTASKFYRKIGLFFIIYTLCLGTIYPFVVKTPFSFEYIFCLTIILSINSLIQYTLSLSLRSLLTVDKKIYIGSFTHSVILILNILFSLVVVRVYPNIHLFKFASGIVFIIQPFIFKRYVKKHYKLVDDVIEDNDLIKERWSGFAINFAAFIHGSTDVTILTLFVGLKAVSIYGIYMISINGLKSLIVSVSSCLNPIIGQSYASNDEKLLNKNLDIYEYINFMMVFVLFVVGSLLITPFVTLYTKGINDADYYQPLLGIMLFIAEGIYLAKSPHLNLAYSANKFKEITIHAYIEAGINIVTSIILVKICGIVGVAIGTALAMLYRTIYHVYFTKKIIPTRKQLIFYKKISLFILFGIIGIIICNLLPLKTITIGNWLLYGVIYTSIVLAIYLIMSLIFFRKEFLYIKDYVFKK